MMDSISAVRRRLLCASACLCLGTGQAWAQDPAATAQAAPAASPADPATAADERPAGTGLEDIIVTARRRNETALMVPVAISALSAQDINRYAATDLSKIGQMIPQVILAKTGGGGGGASFAIRGVGSSALDAGIEQTVSLNIDGLQISRGRLIAQSFFDIAQVEVLKGPQALFFGKNSPGGVISVRTNGPTEILQGYARAGYEFKADQRYVEGAISGPISDTLGFRVAVRRDVMAGYIRNDAVPLAAPSDPTNPSLGAANDRDPGTRETVGRVTLEWKPSTAFDATLKVFGSRLKDNGETAGIETKCATRPQTLDLLSGAFVVDPVGDCKVNGRRTSGAVSPAIAANYPGARGGTPFTRYNSLLTSLTMNLRLDKVTFTSVTGYWKYKNESFDNYNFDSAAIILGANLDDSDALIQELRFNTDLGGPLNFAGGIYLEDNGRDTRGNGALANFGRDPLTGQSNNWQLLTENSGKTYSAYGQAIYDILPNLELAGGVRWTRETKRATIGNSFVNQNFAPTQIVAPAGEFTSGRFADDNFSPEATLTWHPTTYTTLYAAYKTGYKSGGFSNPSILSPGQTADLLSFDPEKAEGGEIGFKASLMGGRLSINSAIYRYTYDGLQLTSFNPNPPSFTIRNAASARTTGIEIDTSYQLTPELQLRLAGGYNRAKYLDFSAAPCYAGQTAAAGCTGANTTQDLSGTALVRAPRTSLNGGVTYDRPLTGDMALGVSADANYTSGYWLLENQNPSGWQKGFTRINATVRLHEVDDRWELALIGRNLLNRYYGVGAAEKPLSTPEAIWVAIGRPRELLVQGTFRF